nr:hypothetical protein [Mycobacterium szulgai]
MTFRSTNFVTIRRDIRKHLVSSPSGQRLDTLVGALLGVIDAATVPTVDLAFPTPTTTRLIRTTNTLPATTAAIEIDVDCEFDSDGKVYLWGALLSTPNSEPAYYAFSSPASDFDEYALAAEFLDWITDQLITHDHTTAFWFHYGPTEPRHLHRILGPAAHDVLARGIRRPHRTPSGPTSTAPPDTASNNSLPPPAHTGAQPVLLAPTPTPGSTRPGSVTQPPGTHSSPTTKTTSAPCAHSA